MMNNLLIVQGKNGLVSLSTVDSRAIDRLAGARDKVGNYGAPDQKLPLKNYLC